MIDDLKEKGSVYEPLELDKSQITTNMNLSIRRSFNSVHNLDVSAMKRDDGYPSVYKEEFINLMGIKKSDTQVSSFFKNNEKKRNIVDLLTKEFREKELNRENSKKILKTDESKKSDKKN
jgi:hypothetical protein